MSKKTYTRKIKCNGTCIQPGQTNFSYASGQFYNNKKDKPICTGYYYDKDSKWVGGKFVDNCPKKSIKELVKYMEVPFVNLSLDSLLNFYKIFNIDDLTNLVERYINRKEPKKNIIRVVNTWMIDNSSELSRLNTQMISIFWNIKQAFWNDLQIDEKNFEKTVKKYYLKWNKKRKEVFYLNFPEDLYNYLKTI
jgi:hypothetical protein